MKQVTSLSRLEIQDDGSVQFEFVYSDGSKDSFAIEHKGVLDFSARMSAASLAKAPEGKEIGFQKFQIAFEAGTGRVFLGLTPAKDAGQVSMIMTGDIATAMGQQLLEAAKKAAETPTKS